MASIDFFVSVDYSVKVHDLGYEIRYLHLDVMSCRSVFQFDSQKRTIEFTPIELKKKLLWTGKLDEFLNKCHEKDSASGHYHQLISGLIEEDFAYNPLSVIAYKDKIRLSTKTARLLKQDHWQDLKYRSDK